MAVLDVHRRRVIELNSKRRLRNGMTKSIKRYIKHFICVYVSMVSCAMAQDQRSADVDALRSVYITYASWLHTLNDISMIGEVARITNTLGLGVMEQGEVRRRFRSLTPDFISNEEFLECVSDRAEANVDLIYENTTESERRIATESSALIDLYSGGDVMDSELEGNLTGSVFYYLGRTGVLICALQLT